MSNILANELLREMQEEEPGTRKCLERIPDDKLGYQPHDKSMNMGILAFVVADIPRWIVAAVKSTELDFATFKHEPAKNAADLVKFFDEHMKSAKLALKNVTDETLNEKFYLKFNGQVVWESTKSDNISSSIRHLSHHRGQLTVYMRLNNIPVPSLYGPTADEPAF